MDTPKGLRRRILAAVNTINAEVADAETRIATLEEERAILIGALRAIERRHAPARTMARNTLARIGETL